MINNKSYIVRNILAAIAIAVIVSACSKETLKTDEPSDEKVRNVLTLTSEQQKAVGLELGALEFRNLSSTLKANGKLTLPAQNQANVSLAVGGIVKSIAVVEGAYVTAGQILAIIQNSDFIQLQQDFLQSKSQLAFLKAEYDRQKELQKDNINAVKTFQRAETDYRSQVVVYNSLKQKLSLYNTDAEKLTPEKISNTFPVVAPISGNIHTIVVNIGTYAEPNKQLFDIVDNRFLHIDLTVFEKDIPKIHEGQKIFFTGANHADHTHNGTIFSINKAFEAGQQAVIAHAEIHDVNEKLLSGMFVEARIILNDSSSQTLPESAVVSNGSDHYIFVQQSENEFRRVQVRLGTNDLGYVEVFPFEDINPKQKVVITGAYNMLSELTKAAAGAE